MKLSIQILYLCSIVLLQALNGVIGYKLRCKDGEFFKITTVFDRNTGFVAGVRVECNQGQIHAQQGDNTQFFNEPAPVGIDWSPEINHRFELKPATCPSDRKMKGFSVWRQGTATVGIQIICELSGSRDDYYINIYSPQFQQFVTSTKPVSTKMCAQHQFVDEFDVDPQGNLINLEFKCYGQEAIGDDQD